MVTKALRTEIPRRPPRDALMTAAEPWFAGCRTGFGARDVHRAPRARLGRTSCFAGSARLRMRRCGALPWRRRHSGARRCVTKRAVDAQAGMSQPTGTAGQIGGDGKPCAATAALTDCSWRKIFMQTLTAPQRSRFRLGDSGDSTGIRRNGAAVQGFGAGRMFTFTSHSSDFSCQASHIGPL